MSHPYFEAKNIRIEVDSPLEIAGDDFRMVDSVRKPTANWLPEDVSRPFLASDVASHITGCAIAMDGAAMLMI